jgi:uncharacterized protein YcbX
VNSVGVVEALWRYPVKSMLGEQMSQAAVDVRGMLGDRLYAVRDADGKFGGGRNSRRFRRMDGLLELRAGYLPDLTPVITLPDGRTVRGDEDHVHWVLAKMLDTPGLTLVKENVISHFDEQPLRLVTTATTRWLAAQDPAPPIDSRRIRPNLVIDVPDEVGRPEDAWVGHDLHVGSHLVIEIVERAMLSIEDGGPEDSTGGARPVTGAADIFLGVDARVRTPGRVLVGDEVRLD